MLPEPLLKQKLLSLLEEDLRFGDISSHMIPPEHKCNAEIICKRGGIIAGVLETRLLFEIMGVTVDARIPDGTEIQKGKVLMTLAGSTRNILSTERTALNLLHRMSAIATTTRRAIDAARKVNEHIRIAATRKTTPGFRVFEKRAVEIGGGDPHRWTLDDMVLLKDTHKAIFARDIAQMVQSAREKTSFTKKIEVEVENLTEAIAAAQAGADIIMFDNMSPEQIITALEELARQNLRSNRLFEASGGLTPETLVKYAATGVDVLSMGAITMYPSERVDLSLEIKP